MPDPLHDLVVYGRQVFGPDVFNLTKYDQTTKQRVRDMQTQYDEATYKQHIRDDPDFEAYEFVDFQDVMTAYTRYPTQENSSRLARHTYRRRFMKSERAEAIMKELEQTYFLRGSIKSFWA